MSRSATVALLRCHIAMRCSTGPPVVIQPSRDARCEGVTLVSQPRSFGVPFVLHLCNASSAGGQLGGRAARGRVEGVRRSARQEHRWRHQLHSGCAHPSLTTSHMN
eukprot:2895850-Pyramimonas_sp.AAC.1